uniref:Uncharacterized protein n=1 Tax=Geladintestivirus 5 TaxID=3233137 RepID=A0AAU8MKV2_9CAUD
MIDEQIINNDIINITNIILEVENLGYIPNNKKYLKLNKNIICKKLNKYNNIFNFTFRQNVVHFYNKL